MSAIAEQQAAALRREQKERKVKVVVWDLDQTLWDGILLEHGANALRPGVREALQLLDERGILQSIASRNDPDLALRRLRELGVEEYFLYPQIHWGTKSESLQRIARDINVGLDTLAFLDDQPFEREEVGFALPQVLTFDPEDLSTVLQTPEFLPRFITDDSRQRRQMYQADAARKHTEEHFEGPQEAFLQTLGMRLTVHRARAEDLRRAEELTLRTNQLNTTGYTYSYDELDAFRRSDDHILLIAGLEDRFGTYGKIGLVLIDKQADAWMIRLLLMSCRVMSRGVGGVLINYLRNEARRAGVRLLAEMIVNERNRMMYMTYKFSHFRELETREGVSIMENDLSREQPYPAYLELELPGTLAG
jgi:FkbH-like protein